ncbi:uncharacterized protein LOC131958456 [Physella acuta]|uniref:uncharacterized protein LOC131958456 n=1 Tax=Physella acuta TaxID=109671 RepID=UPI0027DCF793|nr:uncharacterized protein LOC131958456 [Physella acuta]
MNLAWPLGRRVKINLEYRTPFVFTGSGGSAPPRQVPEEDEGSDLESWDEECAGPPTPSDQMSPPLASPGKCLDMTTESVRLGTPPTNTPPSHNNNNNNIIKNAHHRPSGTDAPHDSTLSSCDTIDHTVLSGNISHNGDYLPLDYTNMGNTKSDQRPTNVTYAPNAIYRSTEKFSVKSILSNKNQAFCDVRSCGDSPTAVAGIVCDVVNSHIHTEADVCGRQSGYVMESTESRRRNFSSSSLPLSLMSSTIEEVDDGDNHVTLANAYSSQRSHSYGGTATPTAKVPFRALRREARVPSLGSPPRARRPGPLTGLVRSASDNTNKVARLRDVDIVGESFESRYPWQRDVGVQCYMPEDTDFHPNLQRAMSGPAMYTYFRSLSMTSNSPASSPPQTLRRSTIQNHTRSCSQSDLIPQYAPYSETTSHMYQRRAPLNRSNSVNTAVNGSDASGTFSFSVKRANFWRRPRPNSMGAVENIRYQHELTKFRELHNTRRDRKSDPQLVLSPGGRRRVALGYPDESGSVSDLESILENPGDRPWDISRQTSVTSIDYDDDVIRYMEGADNGSEYAEDYRMREDVLPSPPISPRMWATFDDDGDIADSDESLNILDDVGSTLKPKFYKLRQPRRLSSGSITSDAESEATEPDPPVVRRGRRAAIYETKNCGDVSPTTLSPEVSPSNSCDEGEGASNIAERLRRRRSSVDLAMNIYPGDLLVQEHHKKLIKRNTIADFYAAGRQPNGVPLPPGAQPGGDTTDVAKKGRQPFSLLKLMKTRSKESLTKLDEILKRLKPSEFKDNHLAAYKSLHWSDLIASTDKQQNSQLTSITDTERKRREAVWELFKSECVFLIDHLMVLKHCFMEPLKKVQVEGSLMFAEPQDLFGNLDELSYVSYTFCKDFIAALLKDMSITDFGRTNVLLKAFQRFSAHSRDGAVYHSYCLNYANALSYLEKLRANSEFAEFEKWCEQDARCNRLQLTDLLVAPMQHCTKLPLLLHNVRKYTADEDERQQVAESIEKMEASLKQLEEKMKWIKNFERVQEIQRQIVWPTVTELDPRCVIPESLKPSLSKQPCERLLACPKRQLLHEGQITLVETPKPLDIHMFLFDDILLITKVKKVPRKSKQSSSDIQTSGQSDRASYIVLRQPLALDRFTIHDISPSDAAVNGLKHCFVLVHISRYQQITGVFTFQAACDATKNTWLTQIRDAMEAYAKAATSRNSSFKENRDPKVEEKEVAPRPRDKDRTEINYQNSNAPRRFLSGSLKNVPTKSRSMDAVFI